MTPVDVPEGAGQVVTLDFLELPMSTRGNDYMLTVVDKFTKMIRLAPTTKTVTAREAADLLITLTLPTFARLPATLISDRDPRFTAEVWRETWAIALNAIERRP